MSGMPAPPSLPPPRRRGGMRRAAGDAGVMKTNDDAQATNLSCVSMGYFRDELLPLLAKCLPSRKPPLINRGTWARHAAMQQVAQDFVAACAQHADGAGAAAAANGHSSGGAGSGGGGGDGGSRFAQQPLCQIVVLGAGSDSRWFNLRHTGWELLPAVRFIELDYQEVVSKKARTVLSTNQLLQLLPDGTTAHTAPVQAPAAAQQPAAGHLALTWTKQRHTTAPAAAAAAQHSQEQHQQPSQQQPLQQQQQQQQPSSEQPAPAAAACAGAGSAAPCDAGSSSSSSGSGSGGSDAPQEHDGHVDGPVPPASVVAHVQELCGPLYSLVGVDLRSQEQLTAALQRGGFDSRLATLYVSECVLVYLEPGEAAALLSAAASAASAAGAPAAVAVYEQTRPDDAFGATMLANLEARGCPLRSITAVPTTAAQEQRLLDTGWAAAAAADMAAVYYGASSSGGRAACRPAPAAGGAAGGGGSQGGSDGDSGGGSGGWLRPHWQAERRRIEGLELLDELEEWQLLQEHYCLALGVLGDGPEGWLARGLQLQQLAALGSAQRPT